MTSVTAIPLTVLVLLFAAFCRGYECGNGVCEPGELVGGCSTDCPFKIHQTHPRLLFSPQDFAFRTEAQSDYRLRMLLPSFLQSATYLFNRYSTQQTVDAAVNTLDNRYGGDVMRLAFAAAITNSADWITKTLMWVQPLLDMDRDYGSDYNQGSRSESLGFIYDYLFANLTSAQKTAIREAIAEEFYGSALIGNIQNPRTTGGHSKSTNERVLIGLMAIYGDGGPNTTANLKRVVNNFLGAGGYVESYAWMCDDGGHFFGTAYGEAYANIMFESLWDTATDEPKATKDWFRKRALWYIYSARHNLSTVDLGPVTGDTWSGYSLDDPQSVAWGLKTFGDPYLRWFATQGPLAYQDNFWSLVGNTLPDGSYQDNSGKGTMAFMSQGVKWVSSGGLGDSGCLQTSATGSGLSLPMLTDSAFPQTQGTVSFWFKGNLSAMNSNNNLFDGWADRDHIFARCNGNILQVAGQQKGVNTYPGLVNPQVAGLDTNSWHFMAITWVASPSNPGTLNVTLDSTFLSSTLRAGFSPNAQLSIFGSRISILFDSIKIFDRALTSTELSALFTSKGSSLVGTVADFSFNSPPVTDAKAPWTDQPISALFPRSGFAFLRSSWDYTQMMHLTFKSTPFWVGNHQHFDENSFALSYQDIPLLTDSGSYGPSNYGSSHWQNYYRRTIAHNTIVVKDPAESFSSYCNDGGQWYNGIYEYPTLDQIKPGGSNSLNGITAFKEHSSFSFVRGDATKSYRKKLSHFTRDIVVLRDPDSDANIPAIVVLYDRVVSTNASFKKTFLLHSISEPVQTSGYGPTQYEFLGTAESAQKDNGPALLTTFLLPKAAETNIVGGTGNEYVCDGTNYGFPDPNNEALREASSWRLEVTAADPSTSDNFLVAMALCKNKKPCLSGSWSIPISFSSDPAGLLDGVLVNGTTLVLFVKDINSPFPDSAVVPIPPPYVVSKVLLVGASPGTTMGMALRDNAVEFWKKGKFVIDNDGTLWYGSASSFAPYFALLTMVLLFATGFF